MSAHLLPVSAGNESSGVYVASRSARAGMWRDLRDEGWPIISTWIDAADPVDHADLWVTCAGEAGACSALVLYVEPGDLPLKGALVEVGIALASGARVVVVAPGVPDFLLGSWLAHPLVMRAPSLRDAVSVVFGATPCSPPPLLRQPRDVRGVE